MKITEVRIFPSGSRDGKLKAFATVTFDDWFVVRNIKIIQGTSGLFVAMPSRKVMDPCSKCGFKNARGSKYCNQCGSAQPEKSFNQQEEYDSSERQAGYMDIAHPVTSECRVYMQKEILDAYEKGLSGGGADEARGAGEGSSPETEREEVSAREPGGADMPLGASTGSAEEKLVLDKEKDIEL